MLTLFTIPKAFSGSIDIIQRNAIKSWTMLEPKCQVILVGDDEGTERAAEELGVRHIPGVRCNEFGTPLLNHSFELAQSEAEYRLTCHVNADIILMDDFIEAVQKVRAQSKSFLMTGRRRDLVVTDLLNFEAGWEDELLSEIRLNGRLDGPTAIDFWAFTEGLFNDMPPFAVGRIATESWLLYRARLQKADLIDSSRVVTSVHQNHDHAHYPGGRVGLGRGAEAQRNREMVGGKRYFFTIRDRTHILTPHGLRRSRDAWTAWRGVRTAPVLYPDMAWPLRLVFRCLNAPIDFTRDVLIKIRSLKRRKSAGDT